MAGVDGWVAQLDQMKAALKDFATQMGAYVMALEENGFTRREAIEIAISWQAVIMSNSGETDDDADAEADE